jgi:hypothetical protein
MTEPAFFVRQGRWDCVAASLAMLTGHSRHTVAQSMAAHGWRNDGSGCSHALERAAARDLGFDLIPLPRRAISILGRDLPDGSATSLSLNYPGLGHSMAWRGGRLWDPNAGRAGR